MGIRATMALLENENRTRPIQSLSSNTPRKCFKKKPSVQETQYQQFENAITSMKDMNPSGSAPWCYYTAKLLTLWKILQRKIAGGRKEGEGKEKGEVAAPSQAR